MSDPIAFVLAALTLLLTPGPTNTLLAASGATVGWRRSACLPLAELLGYSVSIGVLTLLAGTTADALGFATPLLRTFSGVYLSLSAWQLWSEAESSAAAGSLSFGRLFITTVLNPKAVIFSFVILPHIAQGRLADGAPYAAGLLLLIPMAGATWVALGHAIHSGVIRRMSMSLVRRISAVVLATFAVLLLASGTQSGWSWAQSVH